MKNFIICDRANCELTSRLGQEYGFSVNTDVFSEPSVCARPQESIRRVLLAYQNIELVSMHGPYKDLCMGSKDDLIKSVAEPIGDKVGEYIRENGRDKIHPIVVGEIAAAESRPICQWFENIPLGEERIRQLAERIYTRLAEEKAGELAESFHIDHIVEEKVNQMDVLEVEEVLLGIMKKELNAVVNLGAVIGFVIGLLNLLF